MMLNHNGLNYNSKSSMPIPIPVPKKLKNEETLVNYDEYNNSIPKYGSADNSAPSILTQKNFHFTISVLNPLIFQISPLKITA